MSAGKFSASAECVFRQTPRPQVVAFVANCVTPAGARRLAAALNRGERAREGRLHEIAVRDTALAKLGDVRHALRRLVDAGARVPVLRDGGAFAKALAEARRVLGDEPVFAPGGEPREAARASRQDGEAGRV